jgi:hypothetical protein
MKILYFLFKYLTIFYLFFLTLYGCNQGDGFSGMADSLEDGSNGDNDTTIIISAVSPTSNPVIITNSTTTFAIGLSSGNESPSFNFELDNVSVQNSSSPFYNLDGTLLSDGTHTLNVTVSNTISTDSHTFNLVKNSAPNIDLYTPLTLSQSVSCTTGDITFEIAASDGDDDDLTFTWLVDGVENLVPFSITTTTTTSEAVFDPDCSLSGTRVITAQVSDGSDTDTQNWTVVISNPQIATIDSYSPTSDPLNMLSTGEQVFSISASGKAPLTYEWKLDTVTIADATTSIYTLTSASLTPGAHTLSVTVNDSDSSDSYTFNILRNASPVISNENPTDSTAKLNYNSTKSYSIDVSDANNDTMTFTWKLDGNIHTQLSSTDLATSSSGLFTPTQSLMGTHTISVEVTDGKETDTHSWEITVNRFSDICNTLEAGEVCTALGPIGFNDGGSSETANAIRGNPYYIDEDSNGNLFVSDSTNHVIWYYNFTSSTQTVLGVSIPANTAKIVVGNGAAGKTNDGLKNTNFKLNSPRQIAFDSVTNSLFIAEYSNHRIIQILSDGSGRQVIGYGGSGNTTAYHQSGPALDHALYTPNGLALDETNRYLYSASYNHDYIKKFDISDTDYTNWTGEILVGRDNGSTGAIVAGSDENVTTGYSTSGARTYNPYYLKLNSAGTLLFYSEYSQHRVKVVNMTASSASFYDGALTVNANSVLTIVGTGSAGTTTGSYTSARVYYPVGIELYETATLQGIFVASRSGRRVLYANNTASSQTIGGMTVPTQEVHSIFGNGSWTYNGDDQSGINTRLHDPHGLLLSSSDVLYVTTTGNAMVRGLEIDEMDGQVTTKIANEMIGNYIESLNPNSIRMYSPTSLALNSTTNEMHFTEERNGIIRKFNTETGEVSYVLGLSRSHQDQDMTLPDEMYNYYLRDIEFYNDILIYGDRYNSWTTNRGCRIRAYNQELTDITLFNTTIPSGLIGNIMGNWSLGCGSWNVSDGTQATNLRLHGPEGIVSDGTNLFVANSYSHCILKVEPDGSTSEYSGSCTNSGNVTGSIESTSIRYSYPSQMLLDPEYSSDGNFFIIDRSTSSTSSYIKYVNRSTDDIDVAGVTVAAGNVETIFTTPGYTSGIAAKDNWICYSSSYFLSPTNGKHNVECFDRTNILGSIEFRVGSSNSDSTGSGRQLASEYEGLTSTSIRLFSPMAIAFDNEGNLFIAEYYGNDIKMVAKWW